jgi:hypothetical protein
MNDTVEMTGEIHEAAALFPMLSDDERNDLTCWIEGLAMELQGRLDARVSAYERQHGPAPALPKVIVVYPRRDASEDGSR